MKKIEMVKGKCSNLILVRVVQYSVKNIKMLTISNISKAYGDRVLFSDIALNVNAGDRIALIGPNGSGKTTLMDILVCETEADSGKLHREKDIIVGYLKQDISPSSDKQLLQEVLNASETINTIVHKMDIIHEALEREAGDENHQKLVRELGELQYAYETAGGHHIEHEAKTILSGLGFKQPDFQRTLNEFSGGWLMRAYLAKLLLMKPNLLMLDEPTNHLDINSCIWFEKYLAGYRGAVIVTSHDRTFLNRVVDKVWSIEPGKVKQYSGNYDDYVIARQRELEQAQDEATRQQKEIQREMEFVQRFRAKATKASQAQSRLKRIEKIQKVTIARTTKKIHFSFPEPPKCGKDVISLKHINKAYSEHVVYQDLNFVISRRDKVALVGPNGAGKTTLLKILAGVLPFEKGERELGHNVKMAYYAQYVLDLLNPANSIISEIRQSSQDLTDQELRQILGGFLFSGDDIQKPISVLSGGEKARVALAKILVQPGNLLLMDEPTNHLDIASREILAGALTDYRGTLCMITHDRTFIQQVANKIIEVDGGRLKIYPGNYDDYLYSKEQEAFLARGEAKAVQVSDHTCKNNGGSKNAATNNPKQRCAGNIPGNTLQRQDIKIAQRITEIEKKLAALESQLSEIAKLLSDPALYDNATQVASSGEEYQRISQEINLLTREWEELSIEAEKARQQRC